MGIKERILQYIEYKGLKQRHFEAIAGISNGMAAKITDRTTHKILSKILNAFPDLNPEWLMYGNGEMLLPNANIQEQENSSDSLLTIKQRLLHFITKQGLSVKEFEEKCGMSNGYVSTLRKGLPGEKLTEVLKQFPTLNKKWLLYGDGEMIKENNNASVNESLVPVLNLDTREGFDFNREHKGEHIIRRIKWEGARNDDFAVVVSGISMMPVIQPGSFVLLRDVPGWRQFLEYHTLYAIELEDERRLLKVIEKSPEPDKVSLVSYNADYPAQDIDLGFIKRIYKVVGTMTNYGY